MSYAQGLDRLLQSEPGLADILEIEPHGRWSDRLDAPGYNPLKDEVLAKLAGLPGPKIVRGAGLPIGSATRHDSARLGAVRAVLDKLQPRHYSDYLGFARTAEFHTGVPLPPRQTAAGVRNAVLAARRLRVDLGLPIAIENTANYLRPRLDEIPDGRFLGEVAAAADCGILLDLHAAYCNARNGRQTIQELVGQLPLERVWELHLAGGYEADGYWVDAHSGAIPEDLLLETIDLLPRLPNLRAVVFEVGPGSVTASDHAVVAVQLELLKAIRETPFQPHGAVLWEKAELLSGESRVTAEVWESTLGSLAVESFYPQTYLRTDLESDPGLGVYRRLVAERRTAMALRGARLATRLLMQHSGPVGLRDALRRFWETKPPQSSAAAEGLALLECLETLDLPTPRLREIAAYEKAAIQTQLDGRTRYVKFDFDPRPILGALAKGAPIDDLGAPGQFVIEMPSNRTPRIRTAVA